MADGAFPVRQLGEIRDQLLTDYRCELRQRLNPDTQLAFTEDEITFVTAPHSQAYVRASALDAVLLLDQQRALTMAAGVFPGTASTGFLRGIWSPLFDLPYLPASGGSGPVAAPCPAETTFLGSTTVPDPVATYCTDPSGRRYQVLFTVTSGLDGADAELELAAVDTGEQTNIAAGTKLRWQNAGDTVTAEATVTEDFRGGNPAENDQQFVVRLLRRIRHKQGAGNRAQMRAWAEDANSGIDSAFVYACAFHAGSTLVSLVGRRGGVRGPTGRIPGVGAVAAAVARLTPPASPVVPTPPYVLVVPVIGQTVDQMSIQLSMPVGSSGGWADYAPWPQLGAGPTYDPPAVTIVGGGGLTFTMTAPADPDAATVPQLMVWAPEISRFEQLRVQSVTPAGGDFVVLLSAAPTHAIQVGDVISPWTELASTIDSTVEAYFDSLGPGEVVDLSSDTRRSRAYRFPKPAEEFPQRAGTGVLTYLEDVLGSTLADSALPVVSTSTPSIPTDPAFGPHLLVAGQVGVFPL